MAGFVKKWWRFLIILIARIIFLFGLFLAGLMVIVAIFEPPSSISVGNLNQTEALIVFGILPMLLGIWLEMVFKKPSKNF